MLSGRSALRHLLSPPSGSTAKGKTARDPAFPLLHNTKNLLYYDKNNEIIKIEKARCNLHLA